MSSGVTAVSVWLQHVQAAAKGRSKVVTRVVGNTTFYVWSDPLVAAAELRRRLSACPAANDPASCTEVGMWEGRHV
jgi:hypothetical protein